ncbi:PREDICTED: putative B3 domain-containing protein At2g27410 [Camelina sativa]|uniref:B3 domain-containing protein At2g27410 n=1 Tax=Camelina sativa TaxID=90675 RepID=A0ABM1Q883_CAMSA|nr:PREDICTED: putative B3 domain-containing protein At2g27410 [Camelina sativa]
MMKSDDRSFSKQRFYEFLEQTIPENSQTFGIFEAEPSSRPSSSYVNKEYGIDDEDKSFKLLCAVDISLGYKAKAKEDKSKKEEPRVYSGQINMVEMMHEVIGERLQSLLERRYRSITSVEPEGQNPNHDSESSRSSRVRGRRSKEERSIEVEERSRKIRKVDRDRGLEVEPIQMTPPEWLLRVMRREGDGYNPKLISTRKLYKTDLDKIQGRLSVPFKQVKSPDFLTEEETTHIHENSMKLRDDGVSLDLVDPKMKKHALELRKWKMSGNWNYVLCKGWNDVLSDNRFEVNDLFPLWSFRSGEGKLCFALVPSETTSSSHGGGSTSGESERGNFLTGGDGASTSGESGQVQLPVNPPSLPARDTNHSSLGCSGESSSSSS